MVVEYAGAGWDSDAGGGHAARDSCQPRQCKSAAAGDHFRAWGIFRKSNRQEAADRGQVIPSFEFEFVKAKYFNEEGINREGEVPIGFFSVSVLIFVVLCFVLMIYAFTFSVSDCFSALENERAECWIGRSALLPSIFLVGGESPLTGPELIKSHQSALTIAVFAFLGAYLASLKLFIRAVANFDLTPLTFFRANLQIVASVLAAIVLWRAGAALTFSITGTESFAPWIAIAFVIGLYPALGERLLTKLWRQGMIKQIDSRALDETRIIPLELIEGIDADIRSRLEDHNLYDVQNLATANPIILFVETPFGIYQSIDWVGQAQLATAVGVARFLTLRNLGVRTIFDFERMLGPGNRTPPSLKMHLASVLLNAPQTTDVKVLEDRVQEVERLCEIMVDDLAILRLRQIWTAIASRFGEIQSFDRSRCRTPPIR
ncbi:hypothetical protein ACVFYP_01325 [Roseomonas sp. F4]